MSDRYGATESPRTKFLRAAPLLVLGFLYTIYYLLIAQPAAQAEAQNGTHVHASQNRTLGFGEILVAVVPSTTAEHFHHQLHTLELASHRTGVEFKNFDGGGDKKYTKVWKGHMNMLRYMLEQKLETVLILEGSVDWDVRIKDQLYSLSQNMPNATPEHPYGLDWMAMWLSRCGDEAHKGWQEFINFPDSTLALTAQSASTDSTQEDNLRSVHKSKNSGCTVAYAVTAAGAQKILDEIGFEHVNLALDKAEGKTYNLPGLVLTPPLFQEWEQEESQTASATNDFRLGRSVRKALYGQHH